MSLLEFQPVILAAGEGSRMLDISAKNPKALLPIANLPMILYPLQMLDNHGFEEVYIIVLESQRSRIEHRLRAYSARRDTLRRLEYVAIPEDEDWGTADALRFIKDKVKCDLLVVSCDLLADVPLHRVADLHRAHSSTVTALFSLRADSGPDTTVPGTKSKKKLERDFVGIEENTDRLLFLASETDFEETIDIRRSLLRKHPCVDFYSRLTDAHLYFLSKSVLDLLGQLEQMKSLKGEVLPYLIKLQYARQNPENPTVTDEHLQILRGDTDDLFSFAEQLSSYGRLNHGNRSRDNVRCYAHVMKDRFCLRANTLVNYYEANRQMPKNLKTFFRKSEPQFVHPSVQSEKTQIGPDSMIDEACKIDEKVSVKKSIIGSRCQVKSKVKITNSIIMDHVIIEEGSNIQNCIICDQAFIGTKCELKDTIVGTAKQVNDMSKFTNEVIVDLDQMMEI